MHSTIGIVDRGPGSGEAGRFSGCVVRHTGSGEGSIDGRMRESVCYMLLSAPHWHALYIGRCTDGISSMAFVFPCLPLHRYLPVHRSCTC